MSPACRLRRGNDRYSPGLVVRREQQCADAARRAVVRQHVVRRHLGASGTSFRPRAFARSPERVLGWQLAVFGLGGAVGGALAPRLEAWSATRGSVFFGGLIGESLYICMYPMVRNMTWSLAILFLWGATVSLIAVSGYSIMHTTVPDRFMNRVFAIVQQGESAAMLLAMGAAVLLSRVLSTQEIFVAAGLTLLRNRPRRRAHVGRTRAAGCAEPSACVTSAQISPKSAAGTDAASSATWNHSGCSPL